MNDPWPAPLRVSLDVTSACDLACRHCRHEIQGRPEIQLTFDEISRVVDAAAEMGVFRLGLSGGEPMLRRDIIAILLYALKSKVGRVFVSTNGQHLGAHEIEPLLPYRGRLTFKLSLDGPPSLHDRLRGRLGAGAATRQAISILVASGFEVQATTTLMRENISCIEELLAWTSAAGCSRHNFVEVVPVGRATPEMVLTPEERQGVARRLQDASKRCRSGCLVVAKLPFAGEGGFGLRCTGGTEECGILANGSVVGCRLMPELIEGSIKVAPLSEIWSVPESFPLFRRIRPEHLLAPCTTCDRCESCLGGCHAFARALTGDFHGPDARCQRVAAPVLGGEAPCWANS